MSPVSAVSTVGTVGIVGIVGTGSYLPPTVVGNDEVAAAAGVDPGWIESRTRIRYRRRALPEQATSDLAAEAGRRALADAGVSASQVGVVVVATSTPDSPQPPTASRVQHLLGADGAAAFDVNAVCSGFVYALELARALLTAGGAQGHALVIGADVYSRILDPGDRRTAILFGDGAGAVVLGPVPAGLGLAPAVLRGRGELHDLIRVPAGGSRRPASAETLAAGEHWFRMDGRGVRDFVTCEVPGFVADVLAAAAWSPGQVAHLVPHQANGAMLADLAPELGLPDAVLHTTVTDYGNTGSASVAVTLDHARRAGRLQRGDGVLMLAFGGGMNLAGTVCTWAGSPRDSPVLPAVPEPRSTHPLPRRLPVGVPVGSP